MGRKPKLPEGLWERDGVYYARFRANGREVRKRLSTDLRTAKELLNELKSRADKADFGLVDNDYGWQALKDEYLKWIHQAHRRPDEYDRHLEMIEKYQKINRVRQIDAKFVIGYREWRLKDVSPRTVNLEVGTLRHALNKGIEWKLIGTNPIATIKPLPNDNPSKQRRSLTSDEVLRLFDASPEYLKPVWRFLACTGVRKEEMVDLRWSDLDLENKTVTIPASIAKNRIPREIPLDGGMVEILRGLKSDSEFVFLNKRGNPHRNNLLTRFYTVCKKAGIADGKRGGSVDLHSLRVTFTTLALENGATPKAIQAILGHATLGMTMGVYAKATNKSKKEAIDSLPFISRTPAHTVRTRKKKAS